MGGKDPSFSLSISLVFSHLLHTSFGFFEIWLQRWKLSPFSVSFFFLWPLSLESFKLSSSSSFPATESSFSSPPCFASAGFSPSREQLLEVAVSIFILLLLLLASENSSFKGESSHFNGFSSIFPRAPFLPCFLRALLLPESFSSSSCSGNARTKSLCSDTMLEYVSLCSLRGKETIQNVIESIQEQIVV